MGGWTLVDDVPVLSYCMVLFADNPTIKDEELLHEQEDG
jgi:hypothetical protein